jgi:acyl-CoA thioesterase
MAGFASFVSAARQADGSLRGALPDDWRQGRTAYGGFSAALAYHAARDVEPQLPPLRSAQIAFIGPVGSALEVRATVLRRGKSSAFVEARLLSDGQLALAGYFLFMGGRPSDLNHLAPSAPAAPAPEAAEPAMRGGNAPAYRCQLEYRHAAPIQNRGKPEFLRWVRLRERTGLDPAAELLLVADSLPAGVVPLFETPPVVSSANWTVHLHGSDQATQDGWWLVQTRCDSAAGGVSNESTTVWNRAGATALGGYQAVSYFPAAGPDAARAST